MLTYTALVAALLVSATARPTAASVDMTQYMLDHPDYCMSSMQAPKNQRALEFCTWYNDRSCCMPATDVLAEEAFSAAASLGAGCSPTDHRLRLSYREIRQFACLPCDPMEPRYRVDTSVGDVALGGEIAADATADPGTYVWRVCKSFIVGKDGKGGLWGGDGNKFNGCGLNVQPNCDSDPAYAQTGVISGSDVTLAPAPSCDPRFVIPSIEFSNESAADLPQVLADALPSWLDGFNVRVVDDTASGFSYDATPCFRGSAAARGFTAILVAMLLVLGMML